MSVTSFKPTLWEGALIANFHSLSTVESTLTKPISIEGEKVKFNRVGAGVINDYKGTVSWSEITLTPIDMVFDQQKYFAFSLDDCDAAQLKADVLKDVTTEHAAALVEEFDRYTYKTIAAGAKSGNSIGSNGSKIAATPSVAYDKIVDLSTILSKNKVPKSDRYCVVNAEFLGLLSKDKRFTANPVVLANGIVEGQKIASLQIVCSEELPAGQIIAYYKGACGGAKQINKVEAVRLQDSFADGVKGLCKYGAKVLREEAIAVLHYKLGTPADETPTRVEVTNTVTTKAEA